MDIQRRSRSHRNRIGGLPPLIGSLTLYPNVDTYVQRSAATTVRAWTSPLRIYGPPGGALQCNGLFLPDLSQIPTAAQIASATLTLTRSGSNPASSATLSLYRILAANADWLHACTWNYADGDGVSDRWAGDTGGDGGADAGCSQSGVDFSATLLGSFDVAAGAPAGTQYAIALNAAEMTAMLAANHGIVILADTAANYYFANSKYSDASLHPVLVLSWSMPAPCIQITSPQAYQVFQRDGADEADIPITGNYSGSPSAIQARWSGGAWTEIDANPSGGTFSGTLSGQAAGQGTLEVRFADNTAITDARVYVGIGDIFVIAGQSNASGRGTTPFQFSTHATLIAGLFGNNYVWTWLRDRTDTADGQVDSVSDDGTSCATSPWPAVATAYMADRSLPCAFIPCAMGGTSVADWQPGVDHLDRSTLYGSMNYRAQQAGGIRCVLWHQGENDAFNSTPEATYNAALDTLANAIQADLGVELMPALLQDLSTWGGGVDEAPINSAITTAIGDNANVIQGPDLSDITPTMDGVHLSGAEITTAAARWWTAIETAFGW